MNVHEIVYALHFSSGTVKVGRTKCYERRLYEHSKAARAHGVTVTGEWRTVVADASHAESHLMWLAKTLDDQ